MGIVLAVARLALVAIALFVLWGFVVRKAQDREWIDWIMLVIGIALLLVGILAGMGC